MTLADELERVAREAAAHGEEGDAVSGVIPTEHGPGRRVYLCSFDGADGYRSWLALRADGSVVAERGELRAAIAIAALCEVAEDAAGGGTLDTLIERLEEVRVREAPPGIEQAQDAARALREVLGRPPQLATPERLDAIGAATRRLERTTEDCRRLNDILAEVARQMRPLKRQAEAANRVIGLRSPAQSLAISVRAVHCRRSATGSGGIARPGIGLDRLGGHRLRAGAGVDLLDGVLRPVGGVPTG